jgi:transposase InsO family protein
VAAASTADVEIQALSKYIQQHNRSGELPEELKPYARFIDELSTASDGIMMRGQRFLVPRALRKLVVRLAHSGHQGAAKTKAMLRSQAWFPGIDNDVESQVRRCVACQANTGVEHLEPMRPSAMPNGPWQLVDGDFFGPMSGGEYWYVNFDEYSRWASVESIRSTSFNAAAAVLENLFDTFGTPIVYKSDNGPPFQSGQFSDLARKWGFVHRRITPEWPRANGEAERFMKNLGRVLRNATVSGENRNVELRKFLRAYRETPHSTTKVAPALLMMGHCRPFGFPLAAFDPDHLGNLHAQARENDAKGKERMRVEFDARLRARIPDLRVGMKVLLKKKRENKSTTVWDADPYRITEVNGSMLTASRSDHQTTRNSSQFKPFYEAEASESEDEVLEAAEAEDEAATTNEAATTSNKAATAPSTITTAETDQQQKKRGRPTKERATEMEKDAEQQRLRRSEELESAGQGVRRSSRLAAKQK